MLPDAGGRAARICILADITPIRGVRAAATAPATPCHSCCEVVRHAASRVRWYSQSNNCAVGAAGLARPLPAISRAAPWTTAPWRDRYLHSSPTPPASPDPMG